MFGVIAGIKYGNKLRFGIGYNQLYNPPKKLNQNVEYINELGKPYIIEKGLKFYYVSAAIEYTFHRSKHWEVGMPLQIGSWGVILSAYLVWRKDNYQSEFEFYL